MRVINVLLFLVFVLQSEPIFSRDQDWGIFQAVTKLSNDRLIFAEWLRRDNGPLFDQKFFDYFRFSYGKKDGHFVYLLGAGLVDFENRSDEKRLHQFLIYSNKWPSVLLSRNRLGMEERFFDGDPQVYFRIRLRTQINPLPQYSWGLSTYNEIFYVPQGFDRFYTGVNENRFGFGPRFTTKDFEVYLYYMKVLLRSPTRKLYPTWGQLQIRGYF